jgi:hypothetical protein
MSNSESTIAQVLRELAEAFEPLAEAARREPVPDDLITFLQDVFQTESSPLESAAEVARMARSIEETFTSLEPLLRGDEEIGADQIVSLLETARSLIDVVCELGSNLREDEDVIDTTGLEKSAIIVDFLIIEQLQRKHRAFYQIFRFFGIVRNADPRRNRPASIRWNRIIETVRDTPSVLESEYNWASAEFEHERLLVNLQSILLTLSIPSTFVYPVKSDARRFGLDPDVDNPIQQLRIPVLTYEHEGNLAQTGFAVLPTAHEGDFDPPGLVVIPFGQITTSFSTDLVEGWKFKVQSSLDAEIPFGALIRPDQLDITALTDETVPAELEVSAQIWKDLATSADRGLLVLASGIGLNIGSVGLSIGLIYRNETDYFIELPIQRLALIIKGSEGDGFLKELLSQVDAEISFDLTLGLSSQSGFYFRGSGGLEIGIPVHVSLAGVEFNAITMAVGMQGEALRLAAGADVQAKLGPLQATVEGIGLSVDFAISEGEGNLGPIDLNLGFKPPTGVGLSVDGGGFKGGGFLSFEPDKGRYTGVLELEFQDQIAIKAIGLLTTRLPGGAEGFSLLIIITAEFTPIQLGFGFTLNGVGGLLGLNRTTRVKRLRAGVKENTLDNILFPQNVVANANRIISDLRQVFPPQPDRFTFGPMAQIGWGAQSLVTIELGLLIEVPDPVRIAILGVLKATLPNEEAELLKLQVNFLGVIDFEAKRLSFDASLFDSRLLAFTLEGDMALRLSWGNNPNFLLSVGGFHPAYEPPPMNLPTMARLSLQLNWGDVVRLRLETYFAVTSNTVQFGVRLEVWAGSGKFNVYGFLSFDVLFQFNPFRFVAQIGAMLALRVGSKSIASIKLSMALEGPTPWRAKGTAKLKLLFFSVKVNFNKEKGERRNTSLEDVDVLPLLCEALSNKNNWEAQQPSGRHLAVSLKSIESTGDQPVVHPSGVLTISQKVVPLNVEIDKFGSQQPGDANRFTINSVRIGAVGDGVTLVPDDFDTAKEQFAPAQFFEMADEEKLSRKSFEKYGAGVKITKLEKLDAAYAAKRDVKYELWYIDDQRSQNLNRWLRPLILDSAAFNTWKLGGAVAASPHSFANKRRSALAPAAVQVNQEAFAVVKTDDLRPVNGNAMAASEAEALDMMRQMVRENSSIEGEIQVVPAFEVNAET